jgi:hypothetical protein
MTTHKAAAGAALARFIHRAPRSAPDLIILAIVRHGDSPVTRHPSSLSTPLKVSPNILFGPNQSEKLRAEGDNAPRRLAALISSNQPENSDKTL